MGREEKALNKESNEASLEGQGGHTSLLKAAAIPFAIVAIVLLLDLVYVSRPAWVWDETYYYPFSAGVRRWVASPSFDEATIDAVFREGNAHPPLPIYAMAITGALFQADVADFLLAVRLATGFQFALLAVIIYLFVKCEAGRPAALFATVLTVFSPRLFAHSLMATYDVPMCLFWVATTITFYLGMRSRRWALFSGFVFGLALLTKVNAFLLPAALWPWALVFHRKKALPAIASMCVIGPVVFFAGWPWLWMHPVGNLAEYLVDKFPKGVVPRFILSWTGTGAIGWREVAKTLYFGKVSPSGAPWHYPYVMFVITMPLATLWGVASSVSAARRGEGQRGLLALLWWSIIVGLSVFAFVMTPFDGVRLFLAVLPLAAMAAGVGLWRVAARGRWALAAVIALVALSPGVEFFLYEPYGMSYYSPLVGGLPGAEKLGMEVTYYGEAIDPAGLAAINSRAREGDRVTYGPLFKKLPLRMPDQYIRYGRLKMGLVSAAPWDDWDFFVFVNRGGSIDQSDLENLKKGDMLHETRLLGVTLSKILEKRPEAARRRDASGDD